MPAPVYQEQVLASTVILPQSGAPYFFGTYVNSGTALPLVSSPWARQRGRILNGIGNRRRSLLACKFKDPYHRAVQSIVSFIPYSFKELKDIDLVEFSALRHFGMLKYVASLQRHCAPSDVFFGGYSIQMLPTSDC
ncbi:hypothetical protein R1sor_024199 [Riccia sorocarpa]|uniref:Uncharacterized protein n=1 Tax=Riccia sorocarpa TaxID=122646 RepID=A0ABD3GPT5_9MARC